MFDGDNDTKWIEDMNSVMDDSKLSAIWSIGGCLDMSERKKLNTQPLRNLKQIKYIAVVSITEKEAHKKLMQATENIFCLLKLRIKAETTKLRLLI